MTNKKLVSFGDLMPKRGEFDENRIPLKELVGKEIIIVSFETYGSRYGEFAVIDYKEKPNGEIKHAYTFSGVIIAQLKNISEHLLNGFEVKAKVTKTKNYYCLE